MRFISLDTQCIQDPCSSNTTRPTNKPHASVKRCILENTQPLLPPLSRRQSIALLSTLPALNLTLPAFADEVELSAPTIASSSPQGLPKYAAPGPLQPVRLPNLEHTCTTCDAPAERCRLKIHAWVPKGGGRIGLETPFPLAIITPGFLLGADQYTSYAERLASWGFVAVTYDRTQAALDPVSDVVCVSFLRDLIDWCRTSVPLGNLCDVNSIYLIGHSRGGKISTLAAAEDPRVKALFLIDPVDVTVYAPLSPEFPSAVQALEGLGKTGRSLPLAVVGSGRGGDCVPESSNYDKFFAVSEAPAFEVVLEDAGHLQFLDARGGQAMDLVCAAGKIRDSAVSEVTAAMMVAWGELMVRGGRDASAMGDSDMSGKLGMRIDDDGQFVAGVASFDAMQALYATESSVRAALKKIGAGQEVALSTRLKHFDLL